MAKKKKKKRSAGKMHRQVQDSVQALPFIIEQHRREGKRIRAFIIRYFSGPMLRVMNRLLSARRYRGQSGKKLQQTEQMRRHLDQKKAAMRHMQDQMQEIQKKKRTM
jgi:hypothetical protein